MVRGLGSPRRAARDLRQSVLEDVQRPEFGPVFWFPAYFLSAFVVGLVAMEHGLAGSPPAHLQVAVTGLLLCEWPILYVRIPLRAYDFEYLAQKSVLLDREGLFDGALALLGLVLPVLSYAVVLVIVPATWP